MKKQDRRSFLKTAGLLTAAATGLSAESAKAAPKNILSEDRLGVLVDTTACIGCRNCEWACKKAHDLPTESIDHYEDKSVFKNMRRPDESCTDDRCAQGFHWFSFQWSARRSARAIIARVCGRSISW